MRWRRSAGGESTPAARQVARLKRRAGSGRAAKRAHAPMKPASRLGGASRAVLSAGDTSDSDSDAPHRGGLAMDWRAKRV